MSYAKVLDWWCCEGTYPKSDFGMIAAGYGGKI